MAFFVRPARTYWFGSKFGLPPQVEHREENEKQRHESAHFQHFQDDGCPTMPITGDSPNKSPSVHADTAQWVKFSDLTHCW